jgi:hypothetical protein
LDIDDGGLAHDIIISIHEPAYSFGFGKRPGNAMVGDRADKGQVLKGRRGRWIARTIDLHRKLVSLLLTET